MNKPYKKIERKKKTHVPIVDCGKNLSVLCLHNRLGIRWQWKDMLWLLSVYLPKRKLSFQIVRNRIKPFLRLILNEFASVFRMCRVYKQIAVYWDRANKTQHNITQHLSFLLRYSLMHRNIYFDANMLQQTHTHLIAWLNVIHSTFGGMTASSHVKQITMSSMMAACCAVLSNIFRSNRCVCDLFDCFACKNIKRHK